MSALVNAFEECKKKKTTTFVTFITCGYPSLSQTVPLMLALEKGGANVIELGVPFSDPQADGPTIQKAHQVGIEQGIQMKQVLQCIQQARQQGLTLPVVLMGYFNNFLAYGLANVVRDTAKVGGNGFIVVDLPPEEGKELSDMAKDADLGFIPLVSPTTSVRRMKTIAELAHGFVYCVSITGVTGARTDLAPNVAAFMKTVREQIELPVALGFGLSTPEHFKQAGKVADGAVIGSQIIKVIDQAGDAMCEAVEQYCKSIIYI